MTTRDEARLLAPILVARGAQRFILVTSPTHMRRAVAAFRREGLDPVPSVAPMRSDTADTPPLLCPTITRDICPTWRSTDCGRRASTTGGRICSADLANR